MITKCFCKEGFDGKNCENVKRPTTTTTTSTTTSTTELDSKQKTFVSLNKNIFLVNQNKL